MGGFSRKETIMYNPLNYTQLYNSPYIQSPTSNTQLIEYQQNLQNQLNQVNNMISQQAVQQTPQVAQQSVQQGSAEALNIEQLVNSAVQKQLGQLVASPATTILAAIGSALTEEDQIWLSGKLDRLPEFIKTKDGKESVELLVGSFKSYVEDKREK